MRLENSRPFFSLNIASVSCERNLAFKGSLLYVIQYFQSLFLTAGGVSGEGGHIKDRSRHPNLSIFYTLNSGHRQWHGDCHRKGGGAGRRRKGGANSDGRRLDLR